MHNKNILCSRKALHTSEHLAVCLDLLLISDYAETSGIKHSLNDVCKCANILLRRSQHLIALLLHHLLGYTGQVCGKSTASLD